MGTISVYAHIRPNTEVAVKLQDSDYGRYAVLGAGDLSVLIVSREKLLELASLLGLAAQQWEGES